MPDMKTIEDAIRGRLAEVQTLIDQLRAESEQLSKLIATFDNDAPGPRPAASPRRRGATATRAKPSAPAEPSSRAAAKRGRPPGTGNRAQQALAKIAAQPGITAPELAAAMGIAANYLYRVLPRLQT